VTDRPTPFALVFGTVARERFPAIADALAHAGASAAQRDAFVLVEPVARLLQDIAPSDATPDEIDAHLRMLHHAYRHWSAGGWVYRIGETMLAAAAAQPPIVGRLPHPALYLQLPSGKVWRPAEGGAAAEPLDGAFVTETGTPGEMSVLGIFGMHRARPGFSAVAVEGTVDGQEPGAGELVVAAARPDGSPPFSAVLQGGPAAGLYSLVTTGELLLLTCRLLAQLPPPAVHPPQAPHALERVIDV